MKLPFAITNIEGWCDVTHEIGGDAPPWTLARSDGVGALQFSTALYRSGPFPSASSKILLSMLQEFASNRGLGNPTDVITEDGELRVAAASFRWQHNFTRVWILSDGSNFAQATYTSALGEQTPELRDCEQMLRTLRFANDPHAACGTASPSIAPTDRLGIAPE